MPAKPLVPDQRADAVRLKAAFQQWQEAMRALRQPCSQEAAAHVLGFGQSALNQYLGGRIPLNPPALQKFSQLLGVSAESISPGIVAEARRQAASLLQEWGMPPPVPAPAILRQNRSTRPEVDKALKKTPAKVRGKRRA